MQTRLPASVQTTPIPAWVDQRITVGVAILAVVVTLLGIH